MTAFRALLMVASVAFAVSTAAAAERSGELIFKDQCAKCHGSAGEGTKKAPQPLIGEKSPAQLANLIVRTMPEDDPGLLKADDAKKVAAYLHDGFYSPDAQARLNPPRVELARLTVRQYQNSVADLIASFGKTSKGDERHGLRGEYFNGRGFAERGFENRGGGNRTSLIDRIDKEVRFDWGTSAPDGTPAPPPPPPAPPAPKADAKTEAKPNAPKPDAAKTDTKPVANAGAPATPPAPKVDASKPDAIKTDAAKADSAKPEAQKSNATTPAAPQPAAQTPPKAVTPAPAPPPPDPKKFNPKQFCISWDGSVFAPGTGTYEFVVRSEHGVQLWVNDLNIKRPLIDAAVRSGADAQPLRGSILLLGGRSYSLRLEMCKGKELDKKGMDDPKKVSKKASISLLWKTPHGNEELIPTNYLSPVRTPEMLVVGTPFPPDDRSYGWERGTSISKEWNAATTDAALDVAGFVAARLNALSGSMGDGGDAKTKARAFCAKFAERAFRRPLTEAETAQFVERQFDTSAAGTAAPQAADIELAVKRVVLLVLKSPRFLYPGLADSPEAKSPYTVASRLSYALWDSPPDQALLDAAAANKLSTREEISAQAERMLAAPRARVKLREFLMTWLRTDRFQELAKDAKRFPGFDAAVVSDLRTSLEMLLDDVVWSDASDFRQLLLSDGTYLNGRLAKFFGADLPANAKFTRVNWEPGKRAGALTHPYMLAGLAYPAESSPIHRGVFVVRGLLGLTLKPPPDAVAPIAADAHPNLTTRERVALQTKPGACIQCHALINPLGFALENFDAVGRFRSEENAKPIDVSGKIELRSGEMVSFDGARQLAALLAKDEQVHAAFAQQLFQHLAKQPVRAYGLTARQELREFFSNSNFNIRKLVVEIVVRAAQFEGNKP